MESIDSALGMAGQPEELKETLIGLGVVHNMSNVQLDSFAVSVNNYYFNCAAFINVWVCVESLKP